MTAATIPQQQPDARRPGFLNQLSAEWTKLRSARALYIQVTLALVISLGLTALICFAIGGSFDDLSEGDRESFDPVFTGFFGYGLGSIVLIVLGVTFTASEYTSGMVRLSFASTPQRGRWLAAKVALVAIVTFVIGTITAVGGFFIAQAILGSFEGVPTAENNSETTRAVVATAASAPLWPVIGCAIGVIMRSTASAITSTLVLFFAPSLFGGLLPDWYQENILAYLPGNAGDSLLVTERGPGSIYLDPGIAVVTIVAWLAIFIGTAYVLLKRRDV